MSPRRRIRTTALSFVVLASLAVAVSCREPTQITVVVKTGEKCADVSGVEIVVGPDQQATQKRFEQQFTAALSRDCDANGLVGTLVVTPGGAGGTIVVAAGVRVGGTPAPDPATCAAPANVASCIIARRSFSFLDHTSLTLPIELDPLCVGKACDPASTCFKGSCVDASVTCNDSACGLPQEHPGSGSATEAGSSDGAYDDVLGDTSFDDVTDASSGDATMVGDGRADADDGDATVSGIQCSFQFGTSASCDPSNGHGMTMAGGCGGGQGECCHCACPDGGVLNCTISMFTASCRNSCQ